MLAIENEWRILFYNHEPREHSRTFSAYLVVVRIGSCLFVVKFLFHTTIWVESVILLD